MDTHLKTALRPVMRLKRWRGRNAVQAHINRSRIGWLGAFGVSVILWVLILCGIAYSENIPDNVAIRCIIGEASNQGEQGMYALASGLLNRGSTSGVYGCKARHIDKEPKWVWKQAFKALQKAKTKRLHVGDHWEAVEIYGKPKWAYSMKEVYRYKDHVFYAKGN